MCTGKYFPAISNKFQKLHSFYQDEIKEPISQACFWSYFHPFAKNFPVSYSSHKVFIIWNFLFVYLYFYSFIFITDYCWEKTSQIRRSFSFHPFLINFFNNFSAYAKISNINKESFLFLTWVRFKSNSSYIYFRGRCLGDNL